MSIDSLYLFYSSAIILSAASRERIKITIHDELKKTCAQKDTTKNLHA